MNAFLKISLLMASLATSQAATWYVDNVATGSRNGTSWANAWTNLSSVAGISAGDTVYISGGSTTKTYNLWTGVYRQWPVSDFGNGTAGNRITYKIGQDSGHNGTAIFDGGNSNGAATGGGRFLLQNWKHGTISGDYNGENRIVVTNVNEGPLNGDGTSDVTVDHVTYYSGFRFNTATNIELSFCYIKPVPINTDYAVFWLVYEPSGSPASFTNNVIRNCQLVIPVSSNTPAWGSDGIQGGRCSTAVSNLFTTYFVTNNTEWQHTDGWQNGGNSYCQIYANTFENIANYAIYWEIVSSVTNVWVYNNVFRHTQTNSADGLNIGVAIGPQQVSGKVFTNIIVANNTFSDFYGRLAMSIGQTTTTNTWLDSWIVNNLIINSTPLQFFNSSASVANTVTNGISILYNKAEAGLNGNTTFTPGQLLTPGGSATIGFVSYTKLSSANDLHLSSADGGATALGLDLSAYFTTDKDSATWKTPRSIGAFENYSTITPGTSYTLPLRILQIR